ncbi:MAG: putative sulfate exporter family transporter, partial [Chloroflexota bacterium]
LGIPGKALEYPLWAALAGLLGNAALKMSGAHGFVRPGFRTELFLKTGLVLLGAGISFATVATAAAGAILQGVIMITAVFFFSWWLSGQFKLDDKLRAVMSTAIAVCGVSAAVAAAGAVLAKKEQVTYVTALVIVVALPLMVIAPLLAGAMGLPQAVAGAWFGGNIDTTAAVVGAGTIYGEQAQTVASIVKSTQNAMMGVVAFLLAVYFATVVERRPGERPSPRLIWDRFPKFVLGFVAASLLYTFGVIDGGKGTAVEALKNWAFTLAFVCMGLELSVSEIKSMGWSPLIVFLLVTVFNTALALGVAWLIFGILFPVGA